MELTAVRNELAFLKDTLKNLEIMVEVCFNVNDTVLSTLALLEKRLEDSLTTWPSAESSKTSKTESP